MRPIFLVGFMGSGKTTLGRTLSAKMKLQFIDLDIFIENRFRRSVKQIFAERGEEAFRNIERNMLLEVCDFEDTIVACGGGTPCHFDNMEVMNEHGVSVFLNATPEIIFNRLTIPSAKAKRPLVASKTDDELREFIASSLVARAKFYGKATIEFDSSNLEDRTQIAESTDALAALITGYLASHQM